MSLHATHTPSQFSRFSVWRDIPPVYAYLLAAALGIALFLELYPLSFVLGHGAFFETSDPAQHVTGWRYYAQDAWHFPLLQTTRLNYPAGVSIAFTDSIPLAALLFKPVVAWLPEDFHYFGLWHGLVYITQAIAATFLLRALGVKHVPGLIAAVVLTLVWPALIWRLHHTSLMTHSIILATLGCYVRGREAQWRPAAAGLSMVGIALLALLIHPYLFAMSYSLFLMYLVDIGLRTPGHMRWRLPLVLVPLSLATILGIAWGMGYLGQSSTTDGFGIFSMNLQAPFCSGKLYPCGELPTNSPQGEGFNYLGAGVWLLIAAALIMRLRDIGDLLRRYPALAVGMVLFVLYAVSNRIVWHEHLLFSYQVPSVFTKIVNTFRASGRFFWPVGYALLFIALTVLLRRPAKWALPLVVVALPLQWVDVHPHREVIRDLVSRPGKADLKTWQTVMTGVKRVNLYPAYTCDRTNEAIYDFFQRLATQYNATLDTGHVARATPDCALNQDKFAKPFEDDALYVMAAAKLDKPLAIPKGYLHAIQAGQCGLNGEVLVCRTTGSPEAWSGPLALKAIAPIVSKTSRWDGASLPSLIGNAEGTSMVSDKAGYLSFGPYAYMLPGRYRVRILYRAEAPRDVAVGRWDAVYINVQREITEAASGVISGTANEVATINGIITVPRGYAGPWEIRTELLGLARVELLSIDVEPE